MSPDRSGREAAVQGALFGAVLGLVAFAGGEQVLVAAAPTRAAFSGAVATLVAALAAGAWAGALPADDADPQARLASRWVGAGVAIAVAGVFALVWGIAGPRLGDLGRLLGLLLLVALPVYALGLVFPALIGSLDYSDEDDQAEEAGIPGAVVLGALAGFAVGAALAGLVLLPRIPAGPLLLGTAAVFTSPLLRPRRTPPRSAHTVVWEEETPFGTLAVVDTVFPGERQPERRLYLDDEIESGEQVRGGAPTFAYVASAERWLAEITPRGSRYLFLGGGAYTLPRRVAERDPSARITVGELDPEVTRVAGRYFGLRPEHRIRVQHGDARALLEAAGPGEYNRVFVDVYDGQERVPYSLVTRDAWAAAGRALGPGGVVAMNVIGVAYGDGARRFWSVVRTACESFPAVALYVQLAPDYPESQNFLLAASPDAEFAFPARAGSFERWERAEWPAWQGTMVFRDRHAEAGAPA